MKKSEFGVEKEILDRIRKVLASYLQIEKAMIIGSRAKGNYSAGSDIDIVIWGKNLDFSSYLRLIAELEDLEIPYKIDLIKYELIENEEMKKHIERVGKEFYSRK